MEEKLKQLIECRDGGTPPFLVGAWPWQNLIADVAQEALNKIERLTSQLEAADYHG